MPKVTGVFDQFQDLDLISTEDIVQWIKSPDATTIPVLNARGSVPHNIMLENYVANRIFYPQAVPMIDQDMRIDLAILREALRRKPAYFTSVSRKIFIPKIFAERIPNLKELTWAFIDAYIINRKLDPSESVWTVILRGDGDETVGTILIPQFHGKGVVDIAIEGENTSVNAGNLSVIPCPKQRCIVSFKLKSGKILNRDEGALQLYGGKLGIMVDGRMQ